MSSELQKKMEQWTATPPKRTWERITAALDEDEEYQLAQKLYHYAPLPPAGVWEKLEAELNQTTPARVVPLVTRYRPEVRYGSAAAVLLALVITAALVLNRKPPPVEVVQQPVQQSVVTPFLNAETSRQPVAGAPKGRNRHPQGQINDPGKQYLQHRLATASMAAASSYLPSLSLSTIMKNERLEQVVPLPETTAIETELIERYMVLPNDSDEAVKLSKKIYALYRCTDAVSPRECEENLRQLQQRAATPSLLAPADFTGILELIKNIQTHQ